MSEIRILNLCHKKTILVDIYRQSLLNFSDNFNFSVSQFSANFIDHPRVKKNILRIIVSVWPVVTYMHFT